MRKLVISVVVLAALGVGTVATIWFVCDRKHMQARRGEFIAQLTERMKPTIRSYYAVEHRLPGTFADIRPYFRVDAEIMNEGIDLGYAAQEVIDKAFPSAFPHALQECRPLTPEWDARILAFEAKLDERNGDLRAQLLLYTTGDPFFSAAFLEDLVKRGAKEESIREFVRAASRSAVAENTLNGVEAKLFATSARTKENLLHLRVLAWNHQLDRGMRPIDPKALEEYCREKHGQLVWPDDVTPVVALPDFATAPESRLLFVVWATEACVCFDTRGKAAVALEGIVSAVR